MLTVYHATGSRLLGALAFGIGFIALTLAGSELFTENFLVPVNAVVAGQAKVRQLLRLWGGTLAANLAFGWIMGGSSSPAPPTCGRRRSRRAPTSPSGALAAPCWPPPSWAAR